MSTAELAEIDTYIAKSEYLAEIAIECGFQDLAAAIKQDLHANQSLARPRCRRHEAGEVATGSPCWRGARQRDGRAAD